MSFLQILSDARVLVRDSATHRTAQLSITNVTAFHNGVYQCRANDGNDSTVCREGASDIHCLPTTTISTPARIQIVGKNLISYINFPFLLCMAGILFLFSLLFPAVLFIGQHMRIQLSQLSLFLLFIMLSCIH